MLVIVLLRCTVVLGQEQSVVYFCEVRIHDRTLKDPPHDEGIHTMCRRDLKVISRQTNGVTIANMTLLTL